MTTSNLFDLAIKVSEVKTTSGGYVTSKEYNTYMTNAEWNTFKSVMLPSALIEYGAGGGSELDEKNGHPPKMACYGSSSRMIYNLSCNTNGFHFEKKLPTTIGGTANLDGFLEDDDRYVFVEAKCHEPYSAKKNSVSAVYKELYNYINKQMADDIKIKTEPSKCGRYLNAEFFAKNEKLGFFDMKQMICHLLGIATGILKGTLKQKQTDFIYLLYDPSELELDPDTKKEVDSIYARTCYECNLIDFPTLLRVIFDFLKSEKYGNIITNKDLDKLISIFRFTLTSQKLYPNLIQ